MLLSQYVFSHSILYVMVRILAMSTWSLYTCVQSQFILCIYTLRICTVHVCTYIYDVTRVIMYWYCTLCDFH